MRGSKVTLSCSDGPIREIEEEREHRETREEETGGRLP